ncbi:MAG: type II toxin-antitoxin system antitoxin SocA domain-containing protein [Bacteroidota bacterium]
MKRLTKHAEVELRRELSEAKFRKETFPIWRHYYVITATGEEYTNTKLDQLNERQVHNQYRAKYHIPFPVEIERIRKQYGISAAKMSEVLDFGINSYRLYEQGEMIPNPPHAKLIRLADRPKMFWSFVEEKRAQFSPSLLKKMEAAVEQVKETRKEEKVLDYIWNHDNEANEFTGFVKPLFEKVANFVLFFAQEAKPLKTRLNKLLFYCDFLHFKRNGFSISGFNYRAIQMGPVPSHYHELFGILESREFVQIEEELYEHGGTGERFYGKMEFDPSLFTEEELETMSDILHNFEDLRTREIIEISHTEEGWKAHKEQRELISYQAYAFDLRGV